MLQHATGRFDHLLIGTSLPVLLGPRMHYAQAWNREPDLEETYERRFA